MVQWKLICSTILSHTHYDTFSTIYIALSHIKVFEESKTLSCHLPLCELRAELARLSVRLKRLAIRSSSD